MRIAMVVALVVAGCGSDGVMDVPDAGADANTIAGDHLDPGSYSLVWTCLSEPCDYDLPAGILPVLQASDQAHVVELADYINFTQPDGGGGGSRLQPTGDGGIRAPDYIFAAGGTIRRWDDVVLYRTDFGFEMDQTYDDGDGTPEHLYLAATKI